MANVHRITPHLLDVNAPSAIRSLPAWVIWRFEATPGGGKPRKVPYYANGGKRHGTQGSPQDMAHLVTFDAAKAAAARRGFDGVGFATLAQWGICALDFDRCIENGRINPQVAELLMDTYAEFSPSGVGIRAFFRGDLGNGKSTRDGPYGLEIFSTRGFVTFTGNTIDLCETLGNEDTIANIDDKVRTLHASRFTTEREVVTRGEPVGLTVPQIEQALAALPRDLDYDQWVEVGMAIHCETNGEGFDLWDDWSADSPKYTTREYGQARWRSFGRGTGPIITGRSLVKMANEHGAGISLNAPASPEEFDAIAQAPDTEPAPDAAPNRFQVIPTSEFVNRPSPSWIIKGVVPRAELVVLFGESGSGKSFLALDMAACIDQGIPWRGKRTRKGRVVYICAEGAGGFRNRLLAYQKATGIELTIGVIPSAPNLLQRDDALEICKAIGQADLVVIDTFAQTTPGANENAAEDMGKALSHCKGIHRATGAVVMMVHHRGKDPTRGARGWSGIKAAADAELEVQRLEGGRMIRTSKMKDGEDDQAWGFDLKVVEIGIDEDLDPITSCVVIEAAIPTTLGSSNRHMGAIERVVDGVVRDFAKAQREGIEVAAVVTEAASRMDPPTEGKRDTRKMRARRALEALCNRDDAEYWVENECIVLC